MQKIRPNPVEAEHDACIIQPTSQSILLQLKRVTSVATCDWTSHQSQMVQQLVCATATAPQCVTTFAKGPLIYNMCVQGKVLKTTCAEEQV